MLCYHNFKSIFHSSLNHNNFYIFTLTFIKIISIISQDDKRVKTLKIELKLLKAIIKKRHSLVMHVLQFHFSISHITSSVYRVVSRYDLYSVILNCIRHDCIRGRSLYNVI